eukprot:GILJ01019997.1.p1 GENE.GILJ01019997.1~~GILJ01019997.1.p1  ORF type:complete len:237 (+),score=23.35 GILJ01019997.1:742-1452(+)
MEYTSATNHRLDGFFVLHGNEDCLATKTKFSNGLPGRCFHLPVGNSDDFGDFRPWNPYTSKLAAAIVGGIDAMPISHGASVLYIGAGNGVNLSHVSDIVSTGQVFAVEYGGEDYRQLEEVANTHSNIVPIHANARFPLQYQSIISGPVDCIYCDVLQPDQCQILIANAQQFLKPGGGFLMVVDADTVNSEETEQKIFMGEVEKLRSGNLKPKEMLTLEPFARRFAVISGIYDVKRK